MKYQGKNVVVLGLGRSGLAAARLLVREGAHVSIADSGTEESLQKKAALLHAEKITVHLGAAAEGDATLYDFAVLSPGIDPRVPLVSNVTQKGIPLLGELELAYSCCSLPIVAITGTNGKTTTTELTARVLQAAGLRVIACGNIGLPFSEAVLQSDHLDLFVVEVSSFQLETIEHFRPHIAVWLNLSPNHLDRYSTMDEYCAAKLRLFKNQQEDDIAVIPKDWNYHEVAIKARCLTFSTVTQKSDFSFEHDLFFYQGTSFLNLNDTRLRGLHNVENLMAAFAVGVALKLPLALMTEAIKDYVPPVHRCELVTEEEGVIWINDSKATTLDAMEKAILSIDPSRSIVLVAGGKNKGSSFKPILPLIQKRVKMAILIGEIKDSITLEWENIICHQAQSMEEAVFIAGTLATAGDTVLLSPGTSSYDMFSDYQERGDCFKKAVHHYYQNTRLSH